MDDINKLNETGGAGDWGTDKARARLQKDTPGQEITKGKKMKTFKDVLTGIDEAYRKPTAAEIKKDKERERKASGKSRSSMSHKSANRNMYGKMMGGLKDDVQEAMSPAEKKKRLLLIKQAVEKLNRANAEKVKKDALAHMKASGMFDEDLDESTINEVSMPNSLEQAIEIEVDLGVTFDKGALKRSDAEELKREWDLYRLEIRKVIKPLGGLVIDSVAPNPRMTNTKGQRLGTMTIGTRGDTSKFDPRKIKAALSKNVDVMDLKITKLDEALGNKNPSHREKLKLDKDGTIHNIPGKKMGSAYSIKPRIDGGVLKFGTVDEFGNISTMTLADLAKVIK